MVCPEQTPVTLRIPSSVRLNFTSILVPLGTGKLQEVADNDYNLNIPRYVDTFEEEEPIDIKAVMAEIKELEAKRAELDKEIEAYLKELEIF